MAEFIRSPAQPVEIDWTTADEVFIKQISGLVEGMHLPQHAHVWSHSTLLAHGRIRVWAGDDKIGEDFTAPHIINIPAKVKHRFQVLETGTVLYCIHNAARPDVAAVFAEHELI